MVSEFSNDNPSGRTMALALWHVARVGEERGVHRVLVGKSEGKMPLGRPRRRWIFRELEWGVGTG
jgi:hypothetical protein